MAQLIQSLFPLTLSARLQISPFLLPQQWLILEMDKPWDSPENLKPKLGGYQDADFKVEQKVDFPQMRLARCPSTPVRSLPGVPDVAAYIAIAGLGGDAPRLPSKDPNAGVWGYDRCTCPGDITKGLASTMVVARTAFRMALGPLADHRPYGDHC